MRAGDIDTAAELAIGLSSVDNLARLSHRGRYDDSRIRLRFPLLRHYQNLISDHFQALLCDLLRGTQKAMIRVTRGK